MGAVPQRGAVRPTATVPSVNGGAALTEQIGGAFGLAWARTLLGHGMTADGTAAGGTAGGGRRAPEAVGADVLGAHHRLDRGRRGLLALGVLLLIRDVPVTPQGGRSPAPAARSAAAARD